MRERLAALVERAKILGIDIIGIEGDADAIEQRIASYQVKSASDSKRRGGFLKTATAISAPERAKIFD